MISTHLRTKLMGLVEEYRAKTEATNLVNSKKPCLRVKTKKPTLPVGFFVFTHLRF
ncbi:protein of unknown function [Xenorhabdus nematophila AN6/1]|nr:protein of unknown function [Xenorhabdus nematophila AN6/1]